MPSEPEDAAGRSGENGDGKAPPRDSPPTDAASRNAGEGEPEAGDAADRATDAQREETQKSYQTILAQEIEEGLVEIDRPASGQFISGLSAGLDIGFGPFFVAILLATTNRGISAPLFDILVASAYAVGFVFVVPGQSDLFTEHTTLAILPVLHGRPFYPPGGCS